MAGQRRFSWRSAAAAALTAPHRRDQPPPSRRSDPSPPAPRRSRRTRPHPGHVRRATPTHPRRPRSRTPVAPPKTASGTAWSFETTGPAASISAMARSPREHPRPSFEPGAPRIPTPDVSPTNATSRPGSSAELATAWSSNRPRLRAEGNGSVALGPTRCTGRAESFERDGSTRRVRERSWHARTRSPDRASRPPRWATRRS